MENLNRLLAMNAKLYSDFNKDVNLNKPQRDLMNKFLELKSLRQDEINKSQSFLEKWYPALSQEKGTKVIADTVGYTRMQNLLSEKMESLDKNDPEYLSKYINYSNLAFRDVIKRLDNVQNEITKAVEQRLKDAKMEKDKEEDIGSLYYASLVAKLKDRSAFSSKNDEVMSKIKGELSLIDKGTSSKTEVSESEPSPTSSKETPTEFVANKLETEMPSYMDPED